MTFFFKKHDIVKILEGVDFQDNDLTGRTATILNIITPQSPDAHIRVEGVEYDMFFPKDNLKLVERPEAIKPRRRTNV